MDNLALENDRESITALLLELGKGNRDVEALLAPRVHAELRRAALRRMRRERANHTLQATALVNEAWVRLLEHARAEAARSKGANAPFESRAHFFAFASRLMRQILVDHARRRLTDKRGGGQQQVTLDEPVFAANYTARECDPVDILALDEALGRFRRIDERGSRILELHFFGGLNFEEVAHVLGVSTRTIKRDWSLARAWLHDELSPRVA